MYRLRYKIWLDQDGKAFGQGPYNLLAGIKETGSLSQAARNENMSYSQAHTMMKKLSQRLGFPLLISKSGGASGGETKITWEAQEMLDLYGSFYQECESAIEEIFYRYFLANRDAVMQDTLINAFDVGGQGIIAFVGGGGKTTLMWQLAKELADKNKRVLVTTTTHIFPPTGQTTHFCMTDDFEEAKTQVAKKLKPGQIFALGSGMIDNRMQGVNVTWIDKLADGVDYILVEADGSKQKPFKAPANHEPVIPYNATTVVTVVGVDVLGKPLTDEYVHRSQLVSQISGTPEGAEVTVETVANTVISKEGSRKGIPKNAHWIVCINKVDNLALQQEASMVAKYILAKEPFVRIVATSKKTERFVVGRWQN